MENIEEIVESAADGCCGFTPELAILLQEFMVFVTGALLVAGIIIVFKGLYWLFKMFF